MTEWYRFYVPERRKLGTVALSLRKNGGQPNVLELWTSEIFFMGSRNSYTGHVSPICNSVVCSSIIDRKEVPRSMRSFYINATQSASLLCCLHISLRRRPDFVSPLAACSYIQMQTTCSQFARCIYLAWNCFCSCIFVFVLLPVAGSLIISFWRRQ